jgi:nucleoside 2-deoxyribosyltransferase
MERAFVVAGERFWTSDSPQDDIPIGICWQRCADSTRPALVYLAGPYRPYTDEDGTHHSIAQNVRAAAEYGVEIWKRGMVAVIPHTMTYFPRLQQQDGGIKGVAPEVFWEGELELLARCDMLVMMPTWRLSRGATAEREYALALGIPVLEWEEFIGADDQGSGRLHGPRGEATVRGEPNE